MLSRALSRISRGVGARSVLLSAPQKHSTPSLSVQFHSFTYGSPNKFVVRDVSLLHRSILNFLSLQKFGISSSASPEPSEKDGRKEHECVVENNSQEPTEPSRDTNEKTKESGSNLESQNTMPQTKRRRRRVAKRITFSDSDSDSETDGDLSMADMTKLVEEKEGLLEAKQEELEQMKDKVVRTLAEMENVMARTRREAENSKKFAVQNFAKGLLDVADNLGRASTHVKDSFSKIDESKDATGAVPLLKTLLEGVEMTEKQLSEVFRKFGVEKFDPTNEPFDPHRHNAVFQVPDNSKPPGTVAHVLKAGYILYDRVIRPAEVGVTQSQDNDSADNE